MKKLHFILSALIGGMGMIYIVLIAPIRKSKSHMAHLLHHHYAHRGLHTKDQSIPENSLGAFKAAKTAGYGMELDVTLTKDGQVVVFHDDTLLRACGIEAKITEFTYDALQNFRLFDTDAQIPLLSEVLRLVDGHVPLIIELKNIPNYQALCQKVQSQLLSYKGPYCVESFNPMIVAWFKKNSPRTIRGQLSAGKSAFPNVKNPARFMLCHLLTNVMTRPHFVAYRHEDSHHHLGLRLFRALGGSLISYTVTDKDNHPYNFDFFDAVIFEYFNP